jgi:SAM-dependent methyltransferase
VDTDSDTGHDTGSAPSSAPGRATCDLCGGVERDTVLDGARGRYLRCHACGFVYADVDRARWERLNEQEFEASLEDYTARSFAPKKQRRYARKLARLEKWRRPDALLLELGANVGGFLHAARGRGWRTLGVEPVVACAARARAIGLDVRPTTLEAAGLEPASVDAAYANAVLEHLWSPRETMAELARVVRPGGAVYVDTVNHASFTRERLEGRWKLYDPGIHACLYTPATLRRLCEDAGLAVVRTRSHRVRLRPNDAPRARGLAWGLEELRKAPYSLAARFLAKGESIAVLAIRR